MSEDKIAITTTVISSIEKVWDAFTNSEYIGEWFVGSDDWHTPRVENDLNIGGAFNFRMEKKDGSEGFDFKGVYTDIDPERSIRYRLGDNRSASITFESVGSEVLITYTIEAEHQNPLEKQREGWTRIMKSFKHYVERE